VISCHPAIAGAAAGIALIALDECYGEFADRADVASATLIVAGAALAISAAGRGESARQAVAAYWIIAVVAALPIGVDAWRERRRRGDAMRILAAHLAGRDYRGEKAPTRDCEH
jgi:threonine/homoserine efflux transporter RhtA